MHGELTNLLPPERQRTLSRTYFARLSIVVAAFVILLTLASAALLLPTYVFLSQSAESKAKRLSAINAALATSDEAVLSERLAALTKDATTLTSLADRPSASETARAILAVPRPGVALSGFSYSIEPGSFVRSISLSGIAASRDALRRYQLALENSPTVTSASLPVSAYAKDADISFTIAVSFAP